MNEIKTLRTQQINDYISSFDDLRTVSDIQLIEGLRNIIGETPAIDFEYFTDQKLNESTGKMDRKNDLRQIHILYSYIDDNNQPKIGKMSYLVG